MSRLAELRTRTNKPRRRALFLEHLESRALLTAGLLDPSFGDAGTVVADAPGLAAYSSTAQTMAIAPDGKIIVAATIAYENTGADFVVMRYNSDGSLDDSFGVAGKVSIDFGSDEDFVSSVALQTDGKIVVVGNSYQGAPTHHDYALARLNSDGSLDNTFDADGKQTIDFGVDDSANDAAIQSDGSIVIASTERIFKLLAGGSSISFPSMAVTRLTSGGQIDTTFGAGGKQTIDFSIDFPNPYADFVPGFSQGDFITVLADDSILVAGSGLTSTVLLSTSYHGYPEESNVSVARLTPNGQLDEAFGDGPVVDGIGNTWPGRATAIGQFLSPVGIQPDGKILVPIQFGNGTGLARLTAEVELDPTFGVDGVASVSDVQIRSAAAAPDGKIVIAGWSGQNYETSGTDFAVARLLSDGQLDTSFGTSGVTTTDFASRADFAKGMAIQADGNIILAGLSLDDTETDANVVLARYQGGLSATNMLLTTSANSATFGQHLTFTATVTAGTSVPSGTVVFRDGNTVLGTATLAEGTAQFTASVLTLGDHTITATFIATDGYLSISASLTQTITPVSKLATSLVAPALDLSFGASGVVSTDFGENDAIGGPGSMVVQPDGKIVVVGYSTGQAGHAAVMTVARYGSDGTLDNSFGAGGRLIIDFGEIYDIAESVALQSNGKILVAGISEQEDGTYVGALVRLNGDGSFDETFDGDGKLTIDFGGGGIAALAVQTDDTILVISRYASDGQFAVAKLNSDGSFDESFGTSGQTMIDIAGGWATAAAVQPDGKIVVAGITGADFVVLRLNSGGSLDSTFAADGWQTIIFNSTSYASPSSLALQADGKIIVFGTSYGSPTGEEVSNDYGDFAVARLNSDGSLDSSFGSGGRETIDFGSSEDIGLGVALQADGKIVVVGVSLQLVGESLEDGVFSNFVVARLNTIGTLDNTFGAQAVDFGIANDVYAAAYAVTVQPDGKILAVGTSSGNPSGDDFALARVMGYALSIVGTVGADTILIEAGTQSGTLKTTVNGVVTDNIVVDGEMFVGGLAGNDTITVTAALSGGIVLVGGDGSDTYDISFGSLSGTVNVVDSGASGTDELTVHGTAGDDYIFKDDTKVTLGNPVLETIFYGGIETLLALIVHGGAGNDTIVDPGSDTFIFGDEGNDTIVIYATSGSGIVVDGGKGDNNVQVQLGQIHGPVTVHNTAASGQTVLSIVGTDGDDPIDVQADQVTSNGQTIQFSAAISSLTIDTGAGNDQVNVAALSAPLQSLSISTGEGNDAIQVSNLGEAVGSLALTAGEGSDTVGLSDLATSVTTLSVDGGGGDSDAVAISGDLPPASVVENVTTVNHAPVASDQSATTNADTAIGITLAAADVENYTLTYTIVIFPLHGTLSGEAPNLTYLPDAGYIGSDSFTYLANDGSLDSNEATILLTVAAQNTAPTIAAVGGQECTETELNVQVVAVDPDAAAALAYSVAFVSKSGPGAINNPTNFSIDANGLFQWTPGGGQLGQYSFKVTVTDGELSAEQTFVVTTLGVVDGVLTIVGSSGADKIDIKPTDGNPEELTVKINEKDFHYKLKPKNNPDNPYTGVTLIHICGLGGNDQINIHNTVATSAWLEGGAGDDQLRGGEGDDVILGGSGDDQIFGDDGNDMLIGGLGADKIKGEKGHDVLVSGNIAADLDFATLHAISQAWASTKTVTDDTVEEFLDETVAEGSCDTLTGGAGADLFIINTGDTITDFKFGKPNANKDGDVVVKDGVVTA